jgi:hypothetical protein
MTGPWWSWAADGGPEATDNEDGTWTVTIDPIPTETMEYKWVIDGEQEDLVTPAAAGECGDLIDAGRIDTDYSAWGNRYWVLDSGYSFTDYAGACADTAP